MSRALPILLAAALTACATVAERQHLEAQRISDLVCSRTGAPTSDDPAIPLFRDPGDSEEDAQVDLAVERASCDPKGEGE